MKNSILYDQLFMEADDQPGEEKEKRTRYLSSTISALKNNFSFKNMASVFRREVFEVRESKRSVIAQGLLFIFDIIGKSRNPWYYWYIGSRLVAVQAWIVSFMVIFLFAILMTGDIVKALIYVLIGIALENIAIITIPLVILIDYKFDFIPIDMYKALVVPVLMSGFGAFVLNRVSVFIVLHSQRSQ